MTEFTFGVLSFFLSLGQASTQGRIGKYIDFKPKMSKRDNMFLTSKSLTVI